LKYTEISFQAAGGLDSYLHLNDQLLDVVNLTDAQKGQIHKLATERTAENREDAIEYCYRLETLRQWNESVAKACNP
jgi:Spy/CpxP family protein refolding chaperone